MALLLLQNVSPKARGVVDRLFFFFFRKIVTGV